MMARKSKKWDGKMHKMKMRESSQPIEKSRKIDVKLTKLT